MRKMLPALILIVVLTFSTGASTQVVKSDSTDIAKEVVKTSGISSGICVVLECDDALLPVELARAGSLLVHLLDSESRNVVAARATADEAGFPIQRILVEQWQSDSLPHADNTVDIVLIPDSSDQPLRGISLNDVFRVLRPGGMFIGGFQPDAPIRSQLRGLGSDIQAVKSTRGTQWLVAKKPPMKDVDDWSHWEHGPDNNPVSTDQVIRAPYMTQWLGEPYYIAMPAITTVAGGRTFLAMGHIAHHEREEPWLNTLVARNGYNGAELWRMRLPDGYLVHRSAFIATNDTFYMIDLDGNGCLMLDPETGEEKGEINLPELSGEWKWMAMQDGTLFVLAGPRKDPAEMTVVRSQRSHWSWGELSRGYYAERVPWGFGNTIVAYDMKRKRILWNHDEEMPIDSRAMVVGGGKVFFYSPDARIGCIDVGNGDLVWENTDPKVRELIEAPGQGLGSTPGFRTTCFSLYTPEVLFFEAQTRMNVVAISTNNGEFLWTLKKTTNNPNMLYTDGKLHVGIGPGGSTTQVEPLTGKIIKDLGFAKRSCTRLTATPDSLFCRGGDPRHNEGFTRYDRRTGKILFNGAFRPACNDGAIGANGLLYTGPWLCDCNLSLMGTVTLCSAGDFSFQRYDPQSQRLETSEDGTAVMADLDVSSKDWSTYRGDNAHSGHSEVSISGGPVDIWTFEPKRPFAPTTAVSAGGLIFFCGDDGKVRAVDGTTGLLKWSFQTGGPIFQAPTIWKGRAYAGSGDGFIYALEAATGRFLWRFRAAPVERRMMVYGSLCSTWPVNTGVLVEDGVAYAAAGIIDYDGTYVHALDAETGEMKWVNSSSGHLDKELRKGVSAQGNLAVAGGRLWMAGGNVVSPASFDLRSGEYLGPGPGTGSPQANRGEEVGVFGNDYLVFGGRLRYSATENVVNPGGFEIARVTSPNKKLSPAHLCSGRIPPAWDAERMVVVPARLSAPLCYRAEDAMAYANDSSTIPRPLWTMDLPEDSDAVSVVLARNAAVAVLKTDRPGSIQPRWTVCTLDLSGGTQLWRWNLPSAALPGGLLINRSGHIVVVLQNGRLLCFGDVAELLTLADRLAETAKTAGVARAQAEKKLAHLLTVVHHPESRPRVVENLGKLGIDVGSEARKEGCITNWHLMGPVPWDDENPLEKVFISEPSVDISQPCVIGSKTHSWREYLTELASGEVELTRIYGESPYSAIYAYAEFNLPRERNLLLKVGSDDGVLVWFNGEEVHRHNIMRSWGPDQDVIEVNAEKGRNAVLLKVAQGRGGWGFSARLTDLSGNPIDLSDSM